MTGKPNIALTPSQQDYLKALYALDGSSQSVSTGALAHALGVTPASAAQMASRLAALGLTTLHPHHGSRLTARGKALALEAIRHHRLLEAFLVTVLGYSWEEVHPEAERLEHAISERFEAAIDKLLGFPKFDPHGHPIPSFAGKLTPTSGISLASTAIGASVTVLSVSDSDPQALAALSRLHLVPGASLRVIHTEPWGGPLHIQLASGRTLSIPLGLASQVFVSEASSG